MKLKEKIHNKEFSFNIMSNNWHQYEQPVYGENMGIFIPINHLEKQEVRPDKYGKARCEAVL